jgi:hypothetical protein
MYEHSILTRKDTGEKFAVAFLSHWSDIRQVDGSQKFSVKWLGNEEYISAEGVRFTVSKYSDDVNNYLSKAGHALRRHKNGDYSKLELKQFESTCFYYAAKALEICTDKEKADVVAYFSFLEESLF